jgi:ATP-binding protein involved in chromosome partitioning
VGQGSVPEAIRRVAGGLDIVWEDPAHVGHFAARALRLACPCAACVDEMSGRPLLDPASVPRDVAVTAVEPVGAYGIRIRWSDGHGTGIHTFAALRAACPCPRCRA